MEGIPGEMRWERARRLEENQQHYPRYVLSGTGLPLSRLASRKFGEGNYKLDSWLDETCETGFCFL